MDVGGRAPEVASPSFSAGSLFVFFFFVRDNEEKNDDMKITKTSKMTFKGYQRGDGMQIKGEKATLDTTEESTDAISLQRPNMKPLSHYLFMLVGFKRK